MDPQHNTESWISDPNESLASLRRRIYDPNGSGFKSLGSDPGIRFRNPRACLVSTTIGSRDSRGTESPARRSWESTYVSDAELVFWLPCK